MLKRVLIVTVMAVTALPIAASPAWACSCIRESRKDQARRADVVFTGIAKDVWTEANEPGTPKGDEERHARFHVGRRYKGHPGRWVTIDSGATGNSCSFRFEEGRRYTVFADHYRGRLVTNLCSGTKPGRINPERYGFEP